MFKEKTWTRKVTVREGKHSTKTIKKAIGILLVIVAFAFFLSSQIGLGDIVSQGTFQWMLGQAIPADITYPNWNLSFDYNEVTDACQDEDPDVYVVQETLSPDVYGRYKLTWSPVFSFCGIGDKSGTYFEEPNEFLPYAILWEGSNRLTIDNWEITDPKIKKLPSFTLVTQMTIVGGKVVDSENPSVNTCVERFLYCKKSHESDTPIIHLREYPDPDKLEDFITYPCISPLEEVDPPIQEHSTWTSNNCYFTEPVTLSPGTLYAIVDPDREDGTCESGMCATRKGPLETTMEDNKATVHLILAQAFETPVHFKYTVPRMTIPEYLHVRKYSCPLLTDYMLVTETFDAGTPINQYSFRFPVNYFCYDYPVIKTDEETHALSRDYMIYHDIAGGETVTIPDGQTWTFFYVIRNNNLIPAICENGTYDPELDKCVVKPGVVHVCSEGQFDPALGLCVVQAESKVICDQGYYDVAQGYCIYHPPIQAVCERGIYNPDTEKCEYTPPIDEFACDEGYTYNNKTGKCEKYPEKTIICPGNSAYNAETDTCEYTPETEYNCPQGGEYDPVKGVCVIDAPDEPVCTQGVLTWMDDHYVCVISPDLHHECIQGMYDPERDACVVSPNIEYLCLNGEYNEDTGTCVIKPQDRIYCREDFVYDIQSDKCVRYPGDTIRCPENYAYDTLADICFRRPESGVTCDEGTTYNPDRDICEYVPEVGVICPGDTVYNSETDECVKTPEEIIVCNDGFVYDNELDKCVRQAEAIILPGTETLALGGILLVIGLALLFI